MRVAYLVNRYPQTSVSFIRREIHAVEAHGVEVLRFSLRGLAEPLVTDADRLELARTRVVLDAGALAHALAAATTVTSRPAAFARALVTAVRLGWRSHRGVLRHLAYLAEACVLSRWLRRDGVEHVHAHFGTNSAMVALLCHQLGGPPYSFTVHGPEEFDRPEALGLAEKVRHAAFTVAVSSFGRAQLFRWAPSESWRRVHVVRCGLGQELLGGPRSAPAEAPRLVCVGRLSEQKGHLLLLEAAARLDAMGVAFELVLAGDGPLRGALEERIRLAGLEGRVRLTGWLSGAQVREAIASSRAMVVPSFAEGLPVVIMEAFALGRPVIATSIAGVPELVEVGVNGWLVPAGSVDALATAMRSALEAPREQLERMGAAGAARVAQDHDARREASRLVALFRSASSAAAPCAPLELRVGPLHEDAPAAPGPAGAVARRGGSS